ncbi:hypothetical protein MCAP1_000218 [Malassezia caprae]|uniref:UspA domain-containing protein n=1 Tax=Malassezia caprae TaxID=1381934 RepID=A0AAF0ITS1_9BASI|nr:hypothetical protein MCAP1_000218 [Malassezia caprae]
MSSALSRPARRSRMSLFASERSHNDEVWKGYERIVGFDTLPDAEDSVSGNASYTLQVKAKGYARTKHTRTFMCAVDATESSERALEWIMHNLVDDGDEIVAVRVLDWEQDYVDQEKARIGARSLLSSIVELNKASDADRKISVTVEFLTGPIKSTILELVRMYRPQSLTIGTRGKQVSALQKMLGSTPLGNLSKSLIWQSPVPVIIVRPEDRIQKHLFKRLADPRRQEYMQLVQNDKLPLSRPHD